MTDTIDSVKVGSRGRSIPLLRLAAMQSHCYVNGMRWLLPLFGWLFRWRSRHAAEGTVTAHGDRLSVEVSRQLVAKRLAAQERELITERRAMALRAHEQWTRTVDPVIEQLAAVRPSELEVDVRNFIASDDGERYSLATTLNDRYGKGLKTITDRLVGQLPPLARTRPLIARAVGACSTVDSLRILLCGGFDVCSCPNQRLANPNIFLPPATGAGFEFTATPAAGTLYARDRFAAVGAPHTSAVLHGAFTIPPWSKTINVYIPVSVTDATVTLAGLGYSHGWVTLRLRITDQVLPEHDVVDCEEELLNRWTWAGGFFPDAYHRPSSPSVGLMGCFTVTPTAATRAYLFAVELAVDGTVFGAAGVQISAAVNVESMLIISCP